jgi:sugar phosphate isomerase/epimerase
MIRREFLTRLAEGTIVTRALCSNNILRAATGGPAPRAGADKHSRIAVSTWSLHNYFASTRENEFKLPGKMLELLEVPQLIADKYKVHNIEICVPHFASSEAGYLQELKKRLAASHTRVVNMPVDIEEIWNKGGLSDPDKSVRTAAVNASKKWIDVAATIGSSAVRCDPGKLDPKNLAPTLESYKALADYGKSKGVHVIIENHGGVGSEHPEELVALFKGVGGDYIGALPDFANFPDETIREKGLRLLFPYARIVCHAKGLEFDAEGKETKYNFPKCIEISKKTGFKGIYSIEFEGEGDPYQGIQKVLDELLRTL